MAVERTIKTIERPNGEARAFIIERNDRLYSFEGEAETDDGDGHGTYWQPCDVSGLFGSAAEAEQAAHRDVLWLRNLITD